MAAVTARVAALAAGLPERVPALTVDSQCCAGLDAIALARSLIVSGEADVVVAGGVGYGRAPIATLARLARGTAGRIRATALHPLAGPGSGHVGIGGGPCGAHEADPAGARSSRGRKPSKGKRRSPVGQEIVPVSGHEKDEFTRNLSAKTCTRLNTLSGQEAALASRRRPRRLKRMRQRGFGC